MNADDAERLGVRRWLASYFFGECTIDLVVNTSHPARYSGRLKVGNLDTGSYEYYRVSARVR